MPFQKFVEIGRVAFLADGPTTGVTRQAYRQKEMHLTPMKVNFPFNASTKVAQASSPPQRLPRSGPSPPGLSVFNRRKSVPTSLTLRGSSCARPSPRGTRSSPPPSTARRPSGRPASCKQCRPLLMNLELI